VDYTGSVEVLEVPTLVVGEIPASPAARMVEVDGKQLAAFDLEGINALKAMREQARKNTDLLHEMTAANKLLIEERNSLLELAKEIERRSNQLAEEWANSEERKRKAEDLRVIERTVYQIIALIGLALAL
jgi:hypothetical protein